MVLTLGHFRRKILAGSGALRNFFYSRTYGGKSDANKAFDQPAFQPEFPRQPCVQRVFPKYHPELL